MIASPIQEDCCNYFVNPRCLALRSSGRFAIAIAAAPSSQWIAR